jgi:hypothetical protein
MSRKFSFLLLSILFLGTISVFAGNIFVSEDGVQGNYLSENGNTGINFNMSFQELVENGYVLVIENGLVVSVSNGTISNESNESVPTFPSTGLVSYYKFDETSGTTANDEVGTADGIVNNARVFTTEETGKINTCADFTGGEDYLYNMGLPFDFSVTGNYTINFWWKPNTFTDNDPIMDFGTGGSNQAILRISQDIVGSDNKLLFGAVDDAVAWRGYTTTDVTFTDGAWYMLTLVYNSNKNLDLYVNGVNKKTVATTSTQTSSNNIVFNSFMYNGAVDVGGAKGNSFMDEIGIWTRILSSDEVLELYNSGSGLAYS